MTAAIEFVRIVPLNQKFAVEASREFPLEDRVADSEDALLGRLVRQFPKMPEGIIVDIETSDHQHYSLSNEPAPKAA